MLPVKIGLTGVETEEETALTVLFAVGAIKRAKEQSAGVCSLVSTVFGWWCCALGDFIHSNLSQYYKNNYVVQFTLQDTVTVKSYCVYQYLYIFISQKYLHSDSYRE